MRKIWFAIITIILISVYVYADNGDPENAKTMAKLELALIMSIAVALSK